MKVLIVEDSRVVRAYVVSLLHQAGGFEIVGEIADGIEAVSAARDLSPDVILMDVQLPGQNGIEATRQIMAQSPCPIIVLSGQLSHRSKLQPYHALEAGAVDVVHKPRGEDLKDIDGYRDKLVATVQAVVNNPHAPRARVVRPNASDHQAAAGTGGVGRSVVARQTSPTMRSRAPADGRWRRPREGEHGMRALVIGSSTGGPAALRDLLGQLPPKADFAIVVAQHIEAGFIVGLAKWLRESEHRVEVATAGAWAEPGTVWLLAPEEPLSLTRHGQFVSHRAPIRGARPSADVLLSAAATCWKDAAMGVVLTGMGRDGAAGLKAMYDQGAPTLVQDEASSVVWGMPKAALKAGGARHALSISEIAMMIRARTRPARP